MVWVLTVWVCAECLVVWVSEVWVCVELGESGLGMEFAEMCMGKV